MQNKSRLEFLSMRFFFANNFRSTFDLESITPALITLHVILYRSELKTKKG